MDTAVADEPTTERGTNEDEAPRRPRADHRGGIGEASAPEPDAAGGPDSRVERASRDSNQGTKPRSYVVLEQRQLDDLVRQVLGNSVGNPDLEPILEALDGIEVLVRLGTFDAPNTENALRAAAKAAYFDAETARPTLIPVSETYWRPTPVTVKNERTVTVG